MSIVPLRKITLFGHVTDKSALLEELQRLGCLHLVPLREATIEEERSGPPGGEKARKALRYLVEAPNPRRQIKQDPNFDVDVLVAQVEANQQELRDLTDRRDFLEKRIQDLSPWGEFVFPHEDDLAGFKLWFYKVPHKHGAALDALKLPWQTVLRTNKDSYAVVLSQDEPEPDLLPVPRTHAGAKPLSQLHTELEDTEIAIEAAEARRGELTHHAFLLSQNLARAEDRASLRDAARHTYEVEEIFALQGWVPTDRLEALEALAEERKLGLLEEEPGPDELPPTLLKNRPNLAAGQDLAMFYQTPSPRDWDPSVVLFFSFSLFFAMILGDAGYACVLLLGVLAFWRKLGASDGGRRFRAIGLSLAGTSVVWGVLVGSYFGVSPAPDSFLGALKIFDIKDSETMMKISIAIGVCHVALANGMLAWREWGRPIAYAKLGWIAVVFGGLFFWLGTGGSGFLETLGAVGMIGGLVAVFLFSGTTRGHDIMSILKRVLEGGKALTGVMKAFGDILSYLRLFALGLASASLALTFNDMAQAVQQAVPGIGLLFAILILILGHTLNLGLAVVSGVIHGLRLNFIEFYNWGLSEEGYPFKAFAKKEIAS